MVMIPFWFMGVTMSQVTSISVDDVTLVMAFVGGLAGTIVKINKSLIYSIINGCVGSYHRY
jgi:hypothetical protein